MSGKAQKHDGALGVFDSGVGGLTVVGALLRRLPAETNERVLYVADQAHVPYGGRPLEEVRGFASGISRFLAEQGCRAVIMACNISSAVALEAVREELAPLPVLGVIGPAAHRAARPLPKLGNVIKGDSRRHAPRIGVLATEGTVKTHAYRTALQAANAGATVVEVGCPKFVPLVEAEETDTPEALAAAREYLIPLAASGCDTVVLGCTHYPFLLPALRRAAAGLFDHPVLFVDPADEMADAVQAAMPPAPEAPSGSPASPHLLLTTGDADNFRRQAPRFLPGVAFEVSDARWQDGRLGVDG